MSEPNPHVFRPFPRAPAMDLRADIAAHGPWFHNLRLHGHETAPDHFLGDYPSAFFRRFAHVIPASLQGWRVLDIGCNAGFYSFEAVRRGASSVLGIDTEPLYLRQAHFAAEQLQMEVEFRQASVYDVADLDGPYDLVCFLGVLYHLRYPLLALDLLRRYAVGRLLLFQTMLRGVDEKMRVEQDYRFDERWPFNDAGFPRLHFIEHRYANDDSNWWIPNHGAAEGMLRSAGFEIIANPDREVFLCRPTSAPLRELPRAFQR